MPGNPLNITLPTVGVTVGPDYATSINASLTTIIDDIEAKVTPDEISINANLSFASSGNSYAATNVDKINLFEQGSALSGGNTNTIFAYNDELYFQDGAGNNVAMTSGGSVAGAAGNITTSGSPAYAASSVELLWVGGDLEYRFKAGAGDTYADLVFHEADIRNGANTMKLTSNVTSDYAINFPAAGPSAGEIMELDGAGNISFVDTLTTAKTFSGLITASAAITVASGITVSSGGADITGQVDITGATNIVGATDITGALSYSGELSFTDTRVINVSAATSKGTADRLLITADGEYVITSQASDNIFIPINLGDHGDRITRWDVFAFQSLAGDLNATLYYSDGILGATATSGGITSTTFGSAVTLTATSVNITVSNNRSYYILLSSDGAGVIRFYGAKFSYDHP